METAKLVFLSIERTVSCVRETFLSSLNFGSGGNSSAARPLILKNEEPLRMLVTFLSSVSISMSPPLSSRTMPKSFFTGTVVAPGLLIFASTEQVTDTSRSVAVNSTRSFSARMSTLERMGSVVRVLTTFCTAWRPAMIWSLVIVRFMFV